MSKSNKNQSHRLTRQHERSRGVVGIFGRESKSHDAEVANVANHVLELLKHDFPLLEFRIRKSIGKKEINAAMRKVDKELGQTLFLSDASIKPDGGIIEVRDDYGNWRVVLVSEAKHQGKDIENIEAGKLVGKKRNQDVMAAGNAIERSHKNISEIANFMLAENHFPYILFLEGTNFLTQDVVVTRPDGRKVTLVYNSGELNRLDRLTAANYGMPINTNLCRNKFVKRDNSCLMLQAASIYTQGDGHRWQESDMANVMMEVSKTSLQMLGRDLFQQLSQGNKEGGVR